MEQKQQQALNSKLVKGVGNMYRNIKMLFLENITTTLTRNATSASPKMVQLGSPVAHLVEHHVSTVRRVYLKCGDVTMLVLYTFPILN